MELSKLQQIIYDAGIVGAGGAGFPTHKKLSPEIKQIVINAAECEPLMMVDHHIFKKHLRAIIDIMNLMLDATGAEEAIMGIKGKNMHLLAPEIVKETEGTRVKIKEIPDIYPAGDEVVLVYETTGKIIPEGAIPIMVGVMVINTETLYNIKKAIVDNEPVVDKYVTLAGDVPADITVKVPVGMKIKEVFEAVGYGNLEGKAVINGGPMMGKLVDIENDVITKTTKGLLVFPETHNVIQRKKAPLSMTLKRASAACCNCTMCTDMCPRYLLGHSIQVHKVLHVATHANVNDSESFLQSSLCCGCGVCTVMACQQMIDPQAVSMGAKAALAKAGYRRSGGLAPQKPRRERELRLVPSEKLIDRLGIRQYVKDTVKRKYMDFNPDEVYIALSQHVGKPADPTVKVGDVVKRGDVVARTSEDALGTTMHASIDGKIKRIDNGYIVIAR
ncbi:MAG: SLBB domain-containing protein [Clostridia bacterium]|nr:SLBB domain-containing protein [Clostridia bacterium]